MNWICMAVAALAALCLYLASPHQRLARAATARPSLLRGLALLLMVVAIVVALAPYGFWCSVCIALAGSMSMLVALPYLDAWLQRAKGGQHVG